jgi:hypothetical protein
MGKRKRSGWNKFLDGASQVGKIGEKVYNKTIGAVEKKVEKGISSAAHMGERIADKSLDTVQHLGDNVQGALSSLMLPLILGAVAIGAYVFMKK